MGAEYYDSLETREQREREQELFSKLPAQLQHAIDHSEYGRKAFADISPELITSREALTQLPVLRKTDVLELQKSNPPFGGLDAITDQPMTHIFSSPGPIYEFVTDRGDYYQLARALYAAGFRKGMRVHNTFAYHFTPAGVMLDIGAKHLGCTVFPAGVGQTEMQIQTIHHLKPSGYIGTPSFLKIIIDQAKDKGFDVSSLKVGLVSGEALPPSLRSELEEEGIKVFQCYATADLGLIAYESSARDGMIINEGIIVEIVRPGTGDPVEDGEVGEVVVTTLNPDYPLIRFGTGDLSAIMDGTSPCGRTNKRIRGWMGRADQTTKVRGMFVHPSQVAEVVKQVEEVTKARLVISSSDHQDVMALHCESIKQSVELGKKIEDAVRDVCKLRADVIFEEVGTLPNDGVVIEDTRSYD